MVHENKHVKNARYVRTVESMFACPVCRASMKVVHYQSLICSNHHTFDFAKRGYINFMNQPVNTKYSKGLFEARRKLMTEEAFFEPLSHAIASAIHAHVAKPKKTSSILDMGCGEGTLLSTICNKVSSRGIRDVIGAGSDISKAGIAMASKNYSDKVWTVADIANPPFKESQFDVILSILSPSNYAECNRLLRTGGIVVKVVPRSGYLKEIREVLFHKATKKYSNEATLERFSKHFQVAEHFRLCYTTRLNPASMKWLVQMTPLTWSLTEEKEMSLAEEISNQITVDLDVMIGISPK
ncbi:putative RNA methyltransferase [Aureibacillus halotolerans]|uniref:23S rRNA m(1)G-748 methyltransferase n=1 Tax=Aureibacillus halotolerans TaxID=1508390 RepID=A0A4R6TUU3_9BACI|nr:methyltransferase domain-containing protein [Aureibacillus halotolerans]TDQ34594.1 23S rRNA m(1)G-748 methyltransferase [Aureibacillus halotolerans]